MGASRQLPNKRLMAQRGGLLGRNWGRGRAKRERPAAPSPVNPRAVPPSEALSDSGLLKDEISKVETNEEAALSPGANQRLEVRGKGKNRK